MGMALGFPGGWRPRGIRRRVLRRTFDRIRGMEPLEPGRGPVREATGERPAERPSINAVSHVTLHYRMSVLVDGEERELVNTFDAAPATLQMGVGQWSPDIEQRLLGLTEGQKLDVEIPADEAYGVHNPDLVYELDREQLEEQCGADLVYAPGETVELQFIGELPVRGILTVCNEDSAVVDFNHPLAGMSMRLIVAVIGVL
jgi:FKBP-type peptidyl-prolyl cis-trans isomerase SlpA